MKNVKNREYSTVEFIFNVIAIVVVLLLIFSCGARKVDRIKSSTQTETTIENVSKSDSVSQTLTQSSNDIATDQFTIEALDTAKAIEIIAANGAVTKIKNARITRQKQIDKSKRQTLNNTTTKRENQTRTKTRIDENVTKKQVEREQFNVSQMLTQLWWLWLIILLFGYIIYRKYFK